MKKDNSSIYLILQFLQYINRRQKFQIFFLLVLMLFSATLEIINVSAVIPFLGILINPQKIFDLPQLNSYFQYFGYYESKQIVLPITIGFGFLTILTNLIRILALWASTRITSSINSTLMVTAFSKTLYLPYSKHISMGTSEKMAQIAKISIAGTCIMAFFNSIGSVLMLLSILFALIWIDPVVALLVMFIFAIIYIAIISFTKNKLSKYSRAVADGNSRQYKIMLESYDSIKDVIIGSIQEFFINIFTKSVRITKIAEGNVSIISATPRYLIEPLGIILILFIAYFVTTRGEEISNAIPLLGAFALGAQRLLPVLQLCYASWANIRSGHASMEDALKLMNMPKSLVVKNNSNFFSKNPPNIVLNDLSFRYSFDSPWIIKNVNLSILAGSQVGFIGQTGCGKTTLLDLIMGLLDPTEGTIEINGIKLSSENKSEWQSVIAHVPQSIVLTDTSIAENIAFGVPIQEIDYQRVRNAAVRACLMDKIDACDGGLNTIVGERGIKFSGGERQRIGIARALYKNAKVLIFDEATSALDSETESNVMNEINSLKLDGEVPLTFLMIAHRLATLKNCSQIVEMEKGIIKKICEYKDVN
jgi:ABC-type multidrug transport system fused ATPase/permease subunit